MATIPPIPYRIQSVNTKFFAISTQQDKAGQEVDTKDGKNSIPHDSILFTNIPIGNGPTIAEIIGVHPKRLHVSLKGNADNTKLTWSEEKFKWIINKTGQGTYVITPANGADLYWFDEFDASIGNHIAVRPGKNIQPPQNEWLMIPA